MSGIGNIIVIGCFALAGSVALVRAIDYFRARRFRPRVQTIILSHKNSEIIGDGACNWTAPAARLPQRSALVRKMHDPRGM